MCSVVGCNSWRHNVQRFRLPEDPERRLEWVQFLFEVNRQRLKESSWTDITICSEHFTDDCFVSLTLTDTVQLKPGAVPSLCVNTEPEEPAVNPQHVEPVETTDAVSQCDDLQLCNSSNSSPEITEHTLRDALTPGSSNTDLNQELPALQKGKYIVNENCLLELFGHKCPSCGGRLQMVKVTYGELIILNQRCLKCDYKNQWKSQASVPTAADGGLTGGTKTPETQLAVLTDDNANAAVLSEIVTLSEEKSDPSDDEEESKTGGMSSDGDWNPTEEFLVADELTKESEEETEDEGAEEDFDSPGGLEINELCTECGRFFLILKPHTCEHKIKPYSCNICGKRCVSEISLKNHSKVHNETYELPCKYCYITFKTRVDKFKHEQTHQDKKDPFKCPDCPKTFGTSKERRSHLAKHRVSREFKCGLCGIEFKDIHHLRRHSVVHTGLKPYKCSVCQRGFNQTSHLKSHMRLHTGERPYKCQLCEKCFNHNVSLKSHVQRCHMSSSGPRQIDERANDAEGKKNKRDVDSEFDSGEEKQEVQRERSVKPKNKRSTGRPRGRPRRNSAGEIKGKRSNAKTPESKAQKLKKTGSNDEESEDKQSGSDGSFDSAEEEKEEEEEEEEEDETMRRSMESTRRRPNNNSDSDFDPDIEAKKKRYSSQKSVKKRRERSKKGLVV